MYTYEIYKNEVNNYSYMKSFYNKEKVDLRHISLRFKWYEDFIRCLMWDYGFRPNLTYEHEGEVIKFKFIQNELY